MLIKDLKTNWKTLLTIQVLCPLKRFNLFFNEQRFLSSKSNYRRKDKKNNMLESASTNFTAFKNSRIALKFIIK